MINSRSKFKHLITLGIILLGLFWSSQTAFAQSTENLDRFVLSPASKQTTDIRLYIAEFYKFAIPASMLVATVLIMVGGVIWITSAGDQGRIAKAREFIINSIIGIIILMGSYLLLAAINPNLVNLTLPQFSPLSTPGACSIQKAPHCVDLVSKDDCAKTLKGKFFSGQACADLTEEVKKRREEAAKEVRFRAAEKCASQSAVLNPDNTPALPELIWGDECGAHCAHSTDTEDGKTCRIKTGNGGSVCREFNGVIDRRCKVVECVCELR